MKLKEARLPIVLALVIVVGCAMGGGVPQAPGCVIPPYTKIPLVPRLFWLVAVWSTMAYIAIKLLAARK